MKILYSRRYAHRFSLFCIFISLFVATLLCASVLCMRKKEIRIRARSRQYMWYFSFLRALCLSHFMCIMGMLFPLFLWNGTTDKIAIVVEIVCVHFYFIHMYEKLYVSWVSTFVAWLLVYFYFSAFISIFFMDARIILSPEMWYGNMWRRTRVCKMFSFIWQCQTNFSSTSATTTTATELSGKRESIEFDGFCMGLHSETLVEEYSQNASQLQILYERKLKLLKEHHFSIVIDFEKFSHRNTCALYFVFLFLFFNCIRCTYASNNQPKNIKINDYIAFRGKFNFTMETRQNR